MNAAATRASSAHFMAVLRLTELRPSHKRPRGQSTQSNPQRHTFFTFSVRANRVALGRAPQPPAPPRRAPAVPRRSQLTSDELSHPRATLPQGAVKGRTSRAPPGTVHTTRSPETTMAARASSARMAATGSTCRRARSNIAPNACGHQPAPNATRAKRLGTTHDGARTRGDKVKSLALYRLS